MRTHLVHTAGPRLPPRPSFWPLLSLLGCTQKADSADPAVCEGGQTTAYVVDWSTEPDPAIAGVEADFTLNIRNQDGCPIEDLQQYHERMVHSIFVSKDLESFQHLHQEDFTPITAETLREATYTFPITFERSGEHHIIFDFAHQNTFITRESDITVGGDIPQLEAPLQDLSSEVTVDDVVATLSWDVEPVAGYEAIWNVHLNDTAGQPVTDITLLLGADAHAVVVRADLSWVTHTHAWFPGMEEMGPGIEMPHLYDGPDLPFHYALPTGGLYKMWVLLSRSADPDHVYVFPFMFEVAG